MKTIIVVGAGVSGLTSAVRLLEAGHRVAIVSKEAMDSTTSAVAAALWFPFRAYPLEKVIGWSLVSLDRFQRLEREDVPGIATRQVSELYRSGLPPAGWRERLAGFRQLRSDELPGGFEGGYSMEAPVIDSSLYLPYLLKRVLETGGTMERRDLQSLHALESQPDLVVNCSGVGARDLADDPLVVPVRGQVLRVARTGIDDVTVDEGSAEAAYIVPRTNDIILGTTLENGVWSRVPSDTSTADIIRRCGELDPRARDVEVLEARVGLRPGRPEIRLEAVEEDGLKVVHNYGHGGSGFTLSWGCAEEVVRLAEEF